MSWIEKITFQQTFPTGSFQNQKLGIEISFDRDAEHEDAKKVFQLAKDLVNEAFHEMNPQLESSQNGIAEYDLSQPNPNYSFSPSQPIPTKDIAEEKREYHEQEVMSWVEGAKNKGELISYRFLSNQWDSTKQAYLNKLKQFV